MRSRSRVLVIGLDAVSPEVLFPLCEKGLTPTFQKIMSKGAHGELTSTIPPLSAPAWSSIVTGLNPGKHGVYDFVTEVTKNGIPESVVHSSKSLRGRTLWDILGSYWKKSILINIPLTYPPYPINGIMISGFPAPINKLAGYPIGVVEELRKKFPNYKIDMDYLKPNYEGLDEDLFLSEALSLLQYRYKFTRDVLDNHEWDLFFVVFTCPDRIQHVFWGYLNETNPLCRKENTEKYKETIPQLYKHLDEIVGSLMKCVGENTTTIIISDHGFDPLYKKFGLNNWLVEKGLLQRSKFGANHFSLLKSFYTKLARLGVFDINSLFTLLPRSIRNFILPTQTTAPFLGGIKLADLDHDDERREYLKQYIKKQLLNIRDEKDRNIVEKVFYREEIYWGKSLSDAPDLIIVPKRGYKPVKWTGGSIIESIFNGLPEGSVESGIHSSFEACKGILFSSGPEIRNARINSSCLDITPTILQLFGIPIPKDIDGVSFFNLIGKERK